MSRRQFLNPLALLAALSTPLAAQQQVTVRHVTIALVPELSVAAPNSRMSLAIAFEMEPGWHIYFTHPGQSGIATRVTWQLPAGVTLDSLRWPVPARDVTEGLISHIYRDHAVLFTTLHIGAARNPLLLRAAVSFGACETQCVEGKGELSLRSPVGKVRPNPAWQRFRPIYSELPTALMGLRSGARMKSGELLLELSPARAVPPSTGPVTFFPMDSDVLDTCVVAPLARAGAGYVISLGRPNGTPRRLRGILTGWAGRAVQVDVDVGR